MPVQDPTRYLLHSRHIIYEHHPPIPRIVSPLDHPDLYQPVHELRNRRRRNTQRLGQLPDGMRPANQRNHDLDMTRRNVNIRRYALTRDLIELNHVRTVQ